MLVAVERECTIQDDLRTHGGPEQGRGLLERRAEVEVEVGAEAEAEAEDGGEDSASGLDVVRLWKGTHEDARYLRTWCSLAKPLPASGPGDAPA
jgi:hypothetical protein